MGSGFHKKLGGIAGFASKVSRMAGSRYPYWGPPYTAYALHASLLISFLIWPFVQIGQMLIKIF